MSSIFQKINAFAPRLQRPLKAVKTKLAGFAPVIATKKFLFKKAAAIAKPFVRLYVGASKRYRNMRLPSLRRENALEREVGKQIFKRDVKPEDVKKAMVELGNKRGTKEQAAEARLLMESMKVVQQQLEQYAVAAESSEEALDKHLGMVDEKLGTALGNLKDMRWKDYQSRIRGKSNSRIIHFQSLHQLVFGSDHIPLRDRTTARSDGLRHYVRDAQIKRHEKSRTDQDTDLEYAMKNMRKDWRPHEAQINAEIEKIITSQDRTKTRRLQHLMAYRATMRMLDEVLDAPDTNTARQARENLVSEMGDMLGLRETLSPVDELLQKSFSYADEATVEAEQPHLPSYQASANEPPPTYIDNQSAKANQYGDYSPPPSLSGKNRSPRKAATRRARSKQKPLGTRIDLIETDAFFEDFEKAGWENWAQTPFTPGNGKTQV